MKQFTVTTPTGQTFTQQGDWNFTHASFWVYSDGRYGLITFAQSAELAREMYEKDRLSWEEAALSHPWWNLSHYPQCAVLPVTVEEVEETY